MLVRAAEHDLFRAGPLPKKLAAIAARSPLLRSLGQPGGLVARDAGAHLYSLHRGHARRYHRDGAALIGDALHVPNPTAGRGMTSWPSKTCSARRIGPALSSPAPQTQRDTDDETSAIDAHLRLRARALAQNKPRSAGRTG